VSQEIPYAERQQNTMTTAEVLWSIRETALGFENEKKFMEHVLKLQKTGYGLTLIELRKTAFKFVYRNEIRTTSSTEQGMAGYDWACSSANNISTTFISNISNVAYFDTFLF
jgi:hypothetical protein